MADEVEEVAADEVAKKPEKQYTQAEVDRLVNIQKAKLKPINDELTLLKTGQDDTLKAYEAVINTMVQDMAKEIPPSILKLLSKLSPLEQLQYLSDPENNVVFEKKEFPLLKKKAVGKQEFIPTPVEKFV
jgi:preprotein translocase subunit SecA